MDDDELIAVRPGKLVLAIGAVTVAVVVLAVALFLATMPPATASTTPQPDRQHRISNVLTGNGLGTVKFGQSRAAVIAVLTPLLGRSGSGYMRVQAECGVDHTMTWPNWAVVSAHGAHSPLDPVLTAFFDRSRFVGYQYGEFATRAAPSAPSRGTVLATTRGLNIGDTLARGKKLYGRSFRRSSAQGGSWHAGRLDGFAWGAPKYGDVSPQSLVATIDAGDVGCPALSP
jgi:hypothetical protein